MHTFHSLSSPANPLLKDVRRAILRGGLTDEGWCAAESFHLLREALSSGCRVETVLAAESAQNHVERVLEHHPEQAAVLIPDRLFESIASTETSQGVIALVELPKWTLDQLFNASSLVVVLDQVQDPGNAGTIVRAAEAFGASGVMFVRGTASPFNPKTLRASAGSLFRVPFAAAVDPVLARAALERNRLAVFAGMPRDAEMLITEADFTFPCALIAGNEGRGVSKEFRSQATPVAIPTVGVESLNASVAAAILLYEAHRQRSASAR